MGAFRQPRWQWIGWTHVSLPVLNESSQPEHQTSVQALKDGKTKEERHTHGVEGRVTRGRRRARVGLLAAARGRVAEQGRQRQAG